MLGKAFLAYLIISLLQLPLVVLSVVPVVSDFFHTDTPSSIAVRLSLVAFIILFYIPLSFYIAGSTVGFCSSVTSSSLSNDKAT
jgi:hypothetical protein